MSEFDKLKNHLKNDPKTWLITGAAGFIGSHLVENLLHLNQKVVGLDNFSSGKKQNLEDVKLLVGDKWKNFGFVEGDIRDRDTCENICRGKDVVLHNAAIGSVPRSIEFPLQTHDSNVTGFINMVTAAMGAKVGRFVYASSSSVYGDEPTLPKIEDKVGRPLSPYAASKCTNETYQHAFKDHTDMTFIGLRYFNVFGPRQDPEGPYAAVIPRWLEAMIAGRPVKIFGDGETSRDFCFVDNVVQVNLLAGMTNRAEAINQVYNVACSGKTTLNELFQMITTNLSASFPQVKDLKPLYEDFRPGDIKSSEADISKAENLLGYVPTHLIDDGLRLTCQWYGKHFK